jgi:hypothetical protein
MFTDEKDDDKLLDRIGHIEILALRSSRRMPAVSITSLSTALHLHVSAANA